MLLLEAVYVSLILCAPLRYYSALGVIARSGANTDKHRNQNEWNGHRDAIHRHVTWSRRAMLQSVKGADYLTRARCAQDTRDV